MSKLKFITLTFVVDEDLHLKNIQFDENETDLPNNSDTLKAIAIATLKGMYRDKEGIAVQDLLIELGIKKS